MEGNLGFNQQEYISNWSQNLKKQPTFTDSDVEELKSHFQDIFDDLRAKGLDEEEACYIASKRLGSSLEWEEDFKQANNPVIQLKKSVMILSGIVSYFFLYYFVLFSSKLLLYILLVSGIDSYIAVTWIGRYLVSICFLLIISTVSMYFLEDRTIRFLEKIDFRPKKVIFLLLITFLTSILDMNIYPVIKKNLEDNLVSKSQLYVDYLYLDYSFPILVCICFLFLYLKFLRKNKQ